MNHKQKKTLAKAKIHNSNGSKNAVIYTRVSSKEQTENASLETQMKLCLAYADKYGIRVIDFFGGSYESAKSDERREFNRMLNYVKRSKVTIDTILVYSIDRFSRSGANGIYISKQLKDSGISIVSVSSPSDTNTASGILQQNIMFIFSQYDNDLRAEKTTIGMREKLLRREWTFPLPRGYSKDRNTDLVYINEEGLMLRKAFKLFADGSTLMEVCANLRKTGYTISPRKLSETFQNPLYKGVMISKLLNFEPITWKFESIIDEVTFDFVAKRLKRKSIDDYKVETPTDPYLFKGVLKCDLCGSQFTGYLVKKKNLHYYICNNKQCRINVSAKRISLDIENYVLHNVKCLIQNNTLKSLILNAITLINKKNEDRKKELLVKKVLQEERIERLEEKFIDNEINLETYKKHKEKINSELSKILSEINNLGFETSNLESSIEISLKIAANSHFILTNAPDDTKRKLLKLIFPGGLLYNKETTSYRTEQMNSFYLLSDYFSGYLLEKKKGQIDDFVNLSKDVPRAGIKIGVNYSQSVIMNH